MLARRVSVSLALIAAASAVDAGIHKILGSWASRSGTTLIISNEEIKDILKIVVNPLKNSGISIKCLTRTI